MRRRDATDSAANFTTARRWAVPGMLSAALHLLLLVCATTLIVAHDGPDRLIPISLVALSPGDAGGQPAPAPPHPQAALAPAPSLPHAPVVEPHAARHPQPQRAPAHRPAHLPALHAPAAPAAAPPESAVARAPEAAKHTAPASAAPGGPPAAASAHGGTNVATLEAGRGAGGGTGGAGANAADAGGRHLPCVYCPEPRYPLIARARGWEGTVELSLLVLADGSVDSASLRHSSGHDILDRAAIAVARSSRFSPPAAQGLPTPLHGQIEYRFKLSDAD